MTLPSLPEILDDSEIIQQSGEVELYCRRLAHYYSAKSLEEHDKLHYAALADPIDMFCRCLFRHDSGLWEGETLSLKVVLTDVTEE